MESLWYHQYWAHLPSLFIASFVLLIQLPRDKFFSILNGLLVCLPLLSLQIQVSSTSSEVFIRNMMFTILEPFAIHINMASKDLVKSGYIHYIDITLQVTCWYSTIRIVKWVYDQCGREPQLTSCRITNPVPLEWMWAFSSLASSYDRSSRYAIFFPSMRTSNSGRTWSKLKIWS